MAPVSNTFLFTDFFLNEEEIQHPLVHPPKFSDPPFSRRPATMRLGECSNTTRQNRRLPSLLFRKCSKPVRTGYRVDLRQRMYVNPFRDRQQKVKNIQELVSNALPSLNDSVLNDSSAKLKPNVAKVVHAWWQSLSTCWPVMIRPDSWPCCRQNSESRVLSATIFCVRPGIDIDEELIDH
jgi:hypothetical protein